jgi:glycosyltransferase involved in cell wall biosynthesis
MIPLSVTIIAFNEEKNILRTLESVKEIAAEIVVVDSGSTDRTADICQSFGCRVLTRIFDGYGTQKQFAVDQASHDWILSLDADETLTPEIVREIQQQLSRKELSAAGFELPIVLNYMGRQMRYGGLGNKFYLRLFNRKMAGFNTLPVHEGVETKGKTERLKGEVIHYSYRDLSHHIDKINHYTTQAAEGYRQKGRKFPRWWVMFKFPVTFINYYLLRRGFLDGYPGFMWSFLAAFYTSLKIAKSIELNSSGK